MIKTNFRKRDKPRLRAWLDSAIDSLKDDIQYVVEIKERRKKRSLNANAYAWLLIDKIAAYYSITPEAVYMDAVQSVGGNSMYVTVEYAAEQRMREIWESNGIGWQVIKIGERQLTAEYRLVYGSSAYDSKQMSRLIDVIVQECKQIGIETMPEAELESLIKEWSKDNA